MRRGLLALLTVFFLLTPMAAMAHPLGNFSTNQYLGVHVEGDAINIDYVLDLAEIPASQQRRAIDANGDGEISPKENDAFAAAQCEDAARSVEVSIDGESLALAVRQTSLAFPEGEAGLNTLRVECSLTAPAQISDEAVLAISNPLFRDRLGWSELTLTTENFIATTDLPAESRTNRLTSYPEEQLSSPVVVHEGTAVLHAAPGKSLGGSPTMPTNTASGGSPVAGLASLVDPSSGSIAGPLAMAVALGLGALHALAPGHGKTVMAAFLVGSRGTVRQAFGLGLAVASSHTIGVLALGALTLIGTTAFAPEKVFPILSFASGVIVVGIGGWMLLRWLRHRRHGHGSHPHGPHGHSHHLPSSLDGVSGWKVLASMGLAGGLVPSTSAIVLLLAAVNLQRVTLGILLVALFGLGMAATLVGVGLALVTASRLGISRLGSRRWAHRLRHLVSPVAAVVVIGVGVFLSVGAVFA